MADLALAVDIGGTKTAAAAFAPDGVLLHRREAPTPAMAGPQAIIQTAEGLCAQIRAEVEPRHRLLAAGVGTTGHVDHERGSISYASAFMRGWTGVELRRELESRLGMPVSVENDVNALALGEAHFGAGRGFADVLCVAVGTGIGAGLICGGRLQRGASWTAGEIGHVLVDWSGARGCPCGERGHLEAYAAGPAIAAQYCEQRQLPEPLDLRAIAARALHGDTTARQAIASGAQVLGLALTGLLNVIDPQVLIVGGGVSELGDLWWPSLEATLRANPMPGPASVTLRAAELGPDAVLIGAAWLALSEHAAPDTAGERC